MFEFFYCHKKRARKVLCKHCKVIIWSEFFRRARCARYQKFQKCSKYFVWNTTSPKSCEICDSEVEMTMKECNKKSCFIFFLLLHNFDEMTHWIVCKLHKFDSILLSDLKYEIQKFTQKSPNRVLADQHSLLMLTYDKFIEHQLLWSCFLSRQQ